MYYTSLSFIISSSLRGQPLRQEPSESPRRERGVPGVSPSVKKTNTYYLDVEIFQAFHYWVARAPSTYFQYRDFENYLSLYGPIEKQYQYRLNVF